MAPNGVDGGWDDTGEEERSDFFDDADGKLAEDGVEVDGSPAPGECVVDGAFGDRHAKHLFEAESLGAELDVVVYPSVGFAAFVIDGTGLFGTRRGGPEFDDVGAASKAKPVAEDGKGADGPAAAPLAVAGLVHALVDSVAVFDEGVRGKDALEVDQGTAPLAVEILVEGRNGDGEELSFPIPRRCWSFRSRWRQGSNRGGA